MRSWSLLGMAAVPVLAAQLVFFGPASSGSAVSVGRAADSGNAHEHTDGMDMGDMPGMESPLTAQPPAADGNEDGMENMPGMEHSDGSSDQSMTEGRDDRARNVVLAGFGIFNVLVLLVAAVLKGRSPKRTAKRTVKRTAKPADPKALS